MQAESPKSLFIDPIKDLRDRAMDHVVSHGRPMVLGEDFDSRVQKGSGRSFATLAFTSDFLRLLSTCLLADRKLDPSEVQAFSPLVLPSCKLFGKYRPEYVPYATTINKGNLHDFLSYYNTDTSLFGFLCPDTRWAGIAIANNVARLCGDLTYQAIAKGHYSRFGDSLREIAGGQEQEVSLIIENMLSQFESTNGDGDSELDFEIDLGANPGPQVDDLDFDIEDL